MPCLQRVTPLWSDLRYNHNRPCGPPADAVADPYQRQIRHLLFFELLWFENDVAMWIQKRFSLTSKPRGFHLITSEVLNQIPEIENLRIGLLHLFIQHTSASLTINENADPDVRTDMETFFDHLAPETGLPLVHTIEGPDDMPAHVKSSLLGASISIPISAGHLAFGIWQGIYLCEHRNHAGPRHLVATVTGE